MDSDFHTVMDSPLGALVLTGNDEGLTGIYPPQHRHHSRMQTGRRDDAGFRQAVRQLGEYFAGQRRHFELALAPTGTPFQQSVWAALNAIPHGETRSYGQIAASLGQPRASRAVGLANGRNPVSIVVPCHRVIGANGTPTGYAGGLEAKQWLLEHERQSA